MRNLYPVVHPRMWRDLTEGDPMSSELNQMYPVLPRGVTTPPGAVRIQLDGEGAADLHGVISMLVAVENQRRYPASAEAESRSEASEATSPEPESEAAAAATTEEVGEST